MIYEKKSQKQKQEIENSKNRRAHKLNIHSQSNIEWEEILNTLYAELPTQLKRPAKPKNYATNKISKEKKTSTSSLKKLVKTR